MEPYDICEQINENPQWLSDNWLIEELENRGYIVTKLCEKKKGQYDRSADKKIYG